MLHTPETFKISKPVVRSAGGIVAAQHWEAAEAGAAVLRAGGNAIDAAIATALAIGCVEPWMSGIGGGGFMMVGLAAEKKVYRIDYGMIAPAKLDPARYALATEGKAPEDFTFVWPRVVDDRNIMGPEAVGAPGAVAGFSAALERFGTLAWRDVMQPAIKLADKGMPTDWYQTLQIAYGAAAGLGRFSESAKTYLPVGIPPVSLSSHAPKRIQLGRLPETLRRLADAGPKDFYQGAIADLILRDLAGSAFTAEDLAGYEAEIAEVPGIPYRGKRIHLAAGLTGAPTFARALRSIEKTVDPSLGLTPAAYTAWAEALREAYEYRFENLGHKSPADELACTTHLSVVDRDGNMVALTNTLLERFGSRYMGPETGILFNNGMMWFDPEQGKPNSIAPGQRPLSNMCPTIMTEDGAPVFAVGASGGRRIVPTCFQMTSMAADFGMDLEAIYATPRIDVSGTDAVIADANLPREVIDALSAKLPTTETFQSIGVRPFANPQAVMRQDGINTGAAVAEMATSAAVAE
jgi:gamma-glutamyltranspeptidase/glutathione hydrolase